MNTTMVLKAVADETRMKILRLLLGHSYCVRALANELELTEATISQHLKVLRQAGLLVGEKRGYFIHYNVERFVLNELAGEIKALAAIERKTCNPAKDDDCPVSKSKACNKSSQFNDEVKKLCHSTKQVKEGGQHGHCHCHKS